LAHAATLNNLGGARPENEWLTIGLVGTAHAGSHFYQLVMPSLFVYWASAFGLDFAKLGLLMAVFFTISCIGQVAAGFMVDRIGPRPVLLAGMALFVVAALVLAGANGYATLMLAAIIGGIGNCVFHPADFSILNHRVSPNRLGHAFSTHNLTGTLGWALAPIYVVGLAQLFGWRAAVLAVALLMALILVALIWGKDALLVAGTREQNRTQQTQASVQATAVPAGVLETLKKLLSSPALWGAFLFFICATIALSAVQNYTIPLMGSIYGMSAVAAGTVLSGYMAGQIVGMIAGGFLVNATAKTEYVIFLSLIAAAAMFALLASGMVPLMLAAVTMIAAGFFAGLSAPSRDMLIRKVTPKQSIGSVYGLVYSGLDVGSALGPVIFGLMLDAGFRSGPWVGAAVAFIVAALLAHQIGRGSRGPTAGRYAAA
jgi:FSR family fosmidomycin resistance protein-like MFS transporter